jgi:hypothetical protein
MWVNEQYVGRTVQLKLVSLFVYVHKAMHKACELPPATHSSWQHSTITMVTIVEPKLTETPVFLANAGGWSLYNYPQLVEHGRNCKKYWTQCVISVSENGRKDGKGPEMEEGWKWYHKGEWVHQLTWLYDEGSRSQTTEAKHVNFQLKIQENIIHIYTKYKDSLNVVRSMLKTIRTIREKHSCISHMFDLGNTQKTFIVKTPKGVHRRN